MAVAPPPRSIGTGSHHDFPAPMVAVATGALALTCATHCVQSSVESMWVADAPFRPSVLMR